MTTNTAPATQVCTNCHEYRPDVEDGFCPSCGPDEDEDDFDSLPGLNDGGCDFFNKNVTPDIKDLAEEMVTCMDNCGLDYQEQVHYIANVIAGIFPTYKK
jgi:hypothetical protein